MATSDRTSAAAQLVMGVVVVVVAGGVALQSRARERLVCERGAGTCTITREVPLSAVEVETIALAPVVRHEFREVLQSKSTRGATVLTLTSGAERMIAVGEVEQARADFAALDPFFRGEVDRVERAHAPGIAGAVLGAVVALVGAIMGIRGAIALRGAPAGESAGRSNSRRSWRPLVIACAIAGALAAVYVAIVSTRAKLVLECAQRCEVDGMTCFPGQGEVELWTDPGERVVRVWHPGPPESWTEHRVALTAGETTRFRCAPSP